MFFSLAFLLLFIDATNSRPNNYFTNETIIRANESNEILPIFLTGDSSNVAIQDRNDVKLIGRGTVDLILMDRTLDVDIDLNKCFDRVNFCYSSLDKNSEASPLCENDFCGFEVDGTSKTEIDLPGHKGIKRTFLNKCLPIQMIEIKTSYCGMLAASCKPLTGYDKKITIIVEEISSACPTLIKNARIYYPPTTTSTHLPSTKSIATSETSNASSEWYIWVIIGVAFVFIVGIIIALFVCWKKQICLFKKKIEAKKRITITDTVETGIITKAEDIPEPKLESKPEPKPKSKTAEELAPPPKAAKKAKKKSKKSKKSKKERKQKKSVKKDTVDDPIPPEAPVVDAAADRVTPSKEPDFVAPAPPPPPLQMNSSVHPLSSLKEQQILDGDYYTPKKLRSIKSGSSKSSIRKSTGPPAFIIKRRLEPHYSSLRRWKYSALEDSKWKEFEQHYKVEPTKKPLDVEVSLLSGYIGDVFVTINRLIEESRTTLKEKGAEFRANGKAAKKFPDSVYEYLEDPETPEYVRYTAMGSEIGNGVILDETEFQLYSLSALLLIGFTTSISDKKRRHALAVLRRQLPKRRRQTSVEEREGYGFPANAIELAFQRDPHLFKNVEGIKTDSTKNNSEVTQD